MLVTMSCGHAQEVNTNDAKTVQYLQRQGLCKECSYQKQVAADEKKGLPALDGSDKQKPFATRIRCDILKTRLPVSYEWRDGRSIDSFKQWIKEQTDAKDWIDFRKKENIIDLKSLADWFQLVDGLGGDSDGVIVF